MLIDFSSLELKQIKVAIASFLKTTGISAEAYPKIVEKIDANITQDLGNSQVDFSSKNISKNINH